MQISEAFAAVKQVGGHRITRLAWNGCGYVFRRKGGPRLMDRPPHLCHVDLQGRIDDRFERTMSDILATDWVPVHPVQQPFAHPEPPIPT